MKQRISVKHRQWQQWAFSGIQEAQKSHPRRTRAYHFWWYRAASASMHLLWQKWSSRDNWLYLKQHIISTTLILNRRQFFDVTFFLKIVNGLIFSWSSIWQKGTTIKYFAKSRYLIQISSSNTATITESYLCDRQCARHFFIH